MIRLGTGRGDPIGPFFMQKIGVILREEVRTGNRQHLLVWGATALREGKDSPRVGKAAFSGHESV